MANAFGGNPDSSLENMLRTGADRADSATGAASSGVSAAQQGLADARRIGQDINGYLGQAGSLANNAARIVNGADADVDAMRALVPQIGTQVGGISKSADALSNLAALLTGKAGDVSAYAPQVAGIGNALLGRVGQTDALGRQVADVAEGLRPYAAELGAMADDLWGHGHDMVGRSGSVMDQGQGFINMDASSSPMAAEWLRLFGAVNPDVMAAMAGADVQSQYDAARQQQMREIARRGGSVTSGASLALQKQLNTALATAKAAAMNRARMSGYDKQGQYLKEIAALGKDLLGQGTTMFTAGTDAESKAVAARKAAAEVETAIGDLFAKGADIFGLGNTATKGAGDLFGTAAGIEEGAGKMLSSAAGAESASADARKNAISGIAAQAGIHKDAASVKLNQAAALNDTAKTWQGNAQVKNQYLSNMNDANRTLVNSYGTLASAFDAAARYYLGAAGQEVSANNGGGGHGVGGGRSISVGGGADENDFWENTGHTSTWWKNNDPEMFNVLAMQANGANVAVNGTAAAGGGE